MKEALRYGHSIRESASSQSNCRRPGRALCALCLVASAQSGSSFSCPLLRVNIREMMRLKRVAIPVKAVPPLLRRSGGSNDDDASSTVLAERSVPGRATSAQAERDSAL